MLDTVPDAETQHCCNPSPGSKGSETPKLQVNAMDWRRPYGFNPSFRTIPELSVDRLSSKVPPDYRHQTWTVGHDGGHPLSPGYLELRKLLLSSLLCDSTVTVNKANIPGCFGQNAWSRKSRKCTLPTWNIHLRSSFELELLIITLSKSKQVRENSL